MPRVGWSAFYRISRSFEGFLREGQFEDENGRLASGLTDQPAPQLDKPYHLTGELSQGRSRFRAAVGGLIDNKVPGVPIQALRTANPGNRQLTRTGPVTTRDLIAGILEKQRGAGRSNAGQSAFT